LKVCIVSSCGGHLTEVRTLLSKYQSFDHFYVINYQIELPFDMINRTYFITHSERDWKFFLNLYQAFKILRFEKPSILLSAGAGPIVPFSLIAKLFKRTKIIYIETIASVDEPSLTGRLMYFLADYFFYQWPQLFKFFPKGKYGGLLLPFENE
jgi:UDP-N-acetylglucosamine:LPS N-acetylglucosamine transferase